MNPWSVAAWAAAFAAARLALFGPIGGGWWTRRHRSVAVPPATDERAALNKELDRLRLLASNQELELRAQRAHCFALESDLETRESDWARISPTPLAFDSQTFLIDHHTPAADDEPTQWRQRADWPHTRSIAATAAIEGLARRIEAIQNNPPAQPIAAARRGSR